MRRAPRWRPEPPNRCCRASHATKPTGDPGKAALEAHSVNVAAELDGTGVTVNAYRPGAVDTAMQGWIRDQDPDEIGSGLHERFVSTYESDTLLSPARSAAILIDHMEAGGTGQIWDVPA